MQWSKQERTGQVSPPASPTHTACSHLEVIDEPGVVELCLLSVDRFRVDTHFSVSLSVHLHPEKDIVGECWSLRIKVSTTPLFLVLSKLFCHRCFWFPLLSVKLPSDKCDKWLCVCTNCRPAKMRFFFPPQSSKKSQNEAFVCQTGRRFIVHHINELKGTKEKLCCTWQVISNMKVKLCSKLLRVRHTKLTAWLQATSCLYQTMVWFSSKKKKTRSDSLSTEFVKYCRAVVRTCEN